MRQSSILSKHVLHLVTGMVNFFLLHWCDEESIGFKKVSMQCCVPYSVGGILRWSAVSCLVIEKTCSGIGCRL